jgi:UDP-N-acetyl-2-amino-2-deoxyglucuronate dehydrogenase
VGKRDKESIGFGVIGLGIGASHVRAITQTEGAELVALCSLDTARLAAIAERNGVKATYTDYREMLRNPDVDVVCIATPSGMHADMVIDCARAGKHVVCEKPLDVRLDKINAAIRACREHGVKLQCIFQRRFEPLHQKIKETIARGRLGRLVLADTSLRWYRTQEYYDGGSPPGWRGTWKYDGGGAFMNQGIHAIDLLQWLVGPITAVFARTGTYTHHIETEDTGVAVVRFACGALGTVTCTTSAYPGLTNDLHIHGENGSILTSDGRLVAWKIRGEREQEEEQAMLASFGGATGGSAAADPMALSLSAHFPQIRDMVLAIKENREPAVPGEEARRAVRVILALYESARTGREVEIRHDG